MPNFKRYIQLENGMISDDYSNPLFNIHTAKFSYLTADIIAQNLPDDIEIELILNSSGVVEAKLPDGRVFKRD